ncbi:MAG: L,D-transpeptidase family protein, partial [Mycobacteriales bacterium]
MSVPLAMAVRPVITVNHISVVPAQTPTQITGRIRPKLAGRLYLEQLRGHSWHRVQKTTPHHGQFSFTVKPLAYALIHYRVERPSDATHHLAVSRELNIQVVNRELRYGDSGADVRTLQRRLRALHYDVGPSSSFYGWDMVHAVTAFQKVMGFHRDGIAHPQVWTSLTHPKRAHLRHPTKSGTEVEVNLTQQILMIAKNGHIWRILDTSTAGGYTYTDSAGYQATAVTPTGHFTIQYKINRLVKDKLGTLWRPSYFDSSGDAIHGEGDSNYGGDVPPYPASHGCVRITDLAVDRYYNVLAIGVPVWIYH